MNHTTRRADAPAQAEPDAEASIGSSSAAEIAPVYIPTWRRPDLQLTHRMLRAAGIAHVLCVRSDEVRLHSHLGSEHSSVLDLGQPSGIAETRASIVEAARAVGHTTLLMMDDDVTIHRRASISPFAAPRATVDETRHALATLTRWMREDESVGQVALGMLENANRVLASEAEATRAIRVIGLATHRLAERGVGYRPDADLREDFDLTLQVLRAGLKVRVLYSYLQSHRGSNTKGGCETYRDRARNDASVHALVRLHPRYVQAVERRTRVAWGGGARLDVRIAWKRAARDGAAGTGEGLKL